MIRIRFHGRGGHGVKTASRIVGTAAFLSGYESQDSPVYGAERRGAAVVAFTRISDEPILERGPIAQPDLIVVADETLLRDASVGVLAGQQSASAVLINTDAGEKLAAEFGIQATVYAFDVTSTTYDLLGRASALSAGLGAAAARLSGLIAEDVLMRAIRQEFEHLGVTDADVETNLCIARMVFSKLPRMTFSTAKPAQSEPVVRVAYDDPLRGAPSVLAAGNAELRQTGSWRVERPIIDPTVCTRCGLCFVQCPDGAIALDEHGYPVIDYDHCKGCMICRQVCPLQAITSTKETRAW